MSEGMVTAGVWEAVLADIEKLFPADLFQTWFAPLSVRCGDDDSFVIEAPNDFARIWVTDNYLDLIIRRLEMALGRSAKVSMVAAERAEEESKRAEAPVDSARVQPAASRVRDRLQCSYVLNPRNTFENFVVGEGNQLAHAACIAVANSPARAYNPLFLYGETGLGKTHLMHAVAHHILRTRPDANVAYVSTEKFTNEFILAVRDQSLTAFRKRYREVDILLIDDVQFLAGKEQTQQEFFYTFNELFESEKQIFLSSDRPASEIAALESRLVSRFQWGFVTDIQAPDYETRVAILEKKARTMQLELTSEVIEFLAERVSRNVRLIEGALNRVAGYLALSRAQLTIAKLEDLLQDTLQEAAEATPSVAMIQQRVADYYKIPVAEMTGRRRPANIAFARQVAMYLSRVLTSHSLQDIGAAFGGRDHGTVLYACRTVENIMEQEQPVKRAVDYLQKQLAKGR